jgi:Pyruvate/2-oxoacid:ferredoxin oxidoreductase delta subunit
MKDGPSFRGRAITHTIKKQKLMVPHVDVFKCTGCGTCIRKCPEHIIGLMNNEAAILTDLCVECGICAFVCPFVSIVNELPNGGYETGNIMHLSRR